jgi:hypothetical protein
MDCVKAGKAGTNDDRVVFFPLELSAAVNRGIRL